MARDKFLEAFASESAAGQPMTESAKPVKPAAEFVLGRLSESEAKQYDRQMSESLSSARVLQRIDELVAEYLDDLRHGVVIGENMSPRIIRARLFKEFPGMDRKEIEWQIERSITRHQKIQNAGV